MRGKIVFCDGLSSSKYVGFASGAAGLIFNSSGPLVAAEVYALPAIRLSTSDGNSVSSYLKSTRYKTFLQSIKDHT